MGPFPHDAPPAAIIDATTRWAPTASSSSSSPIPSPTSSHALFSTMGFVAVARHRKTRNITLYRQGDINYLVNAEPGSFAARFVAEHGPCAPSMAFRVVDAQAGLRACAVARREARRHVARHRQTLDVPAIEGIGGSLLYFVDRYGAKGSTYDAEFDWTRRARPAARGRSASITSTT